MSYAMWEWPLRRRVARSLKALRENSGKNVDQVAADTGLAKNAVFSLERQGSKNVPLEHVYRLARYYDADFCGILKGHRRPPAMRPAMPDYATLDTQVRQRMRAARLAMDGGKGMGTFVLASRAKVHQTWIVREESGEIDTLDLARLDRIAKVLQTDLIDWLIP